MSKPTPTYFEACQVARDLTGSLAQMPDIASVYRCAMIMGMQFHALAPEWSERVLQEWRACPPSTSVVLQSQFVHASIDRARAVRAMFDAERAAMPDFHGGIKPLPEPEPQEHQTDAPEASDG